MTWTKVSEKLPPENVPEGGKMRMEQGCRYSEKIILRRKEYQGKQYWDWTLPNPYEP